MEAQGEITGIIGFIAIQLSAVHFHDAVAHPLQEIAVVGDHDEAAPEGAQIIFQPYNTFAVQMVGGFVQQQKLRRAQQGRGQSRPLALSARQRSHRCIVILQAQPLQHGFAFIFRTALRICHHLGKHGGIGIHVRPLGEKGTAHSGGKNHLACVRLFRTGEQAQQSAFSSAVQTHDTHFIMVFQVEVGLLQNGPHPKMNGKLLGGKDHSALLLSNRFSHQRALRTEAGDRFS